MCTLCSRRAFIAGAASVFTLRPSISSATEGRGQIACGFSNEQDFSKILQETLSTRSSMPHGDSSFHRALVYELKSILEAIPVRPGFQYVEAHNAFAMGISYVSGTQGTVFIGVSLVRKLLEPSDGGISVAGVLAHECAHVFQFFSPYFDRLMGPTAVLCELHADVLAGYYLARKIGGSTDKLNVLQRELIKSGTFNERDPKHHGTGGQRNAALDFGYMLARDKSSFEDTAREGEKYVRGLVRPR